MSLANQFLWNAGQSIEKYFKAILLLHGKPTRDLSHALSKAASRIDSLPHFGLSISDGSREFIDQLDGDQYMNRYQQNHTEMVQALTTFDMTVWEVRLHCQEIRPDEDYEDRTNQLTERIRARIKAPNPQHFSLGHDLLTRTIRSKKPSARKEALLWKNYWFDNQNNNEVELELSFSYSLPYEVRKPALRAFLDRYIQLSSSSG